MPKFFKYLIVFTALLAVVLVGASLVLRAYLTDARVRALIIPPLEKALGRSVEIGHIKVSLFSGIQVYDFVIKEENGKNNFLSSGQFTLFYDLLPLLGKKLVISDARLVDPAIRVVRDWQGNFNFSTLALLADKELPADQESTAKKAADKTTLPFSVEVRNFSLENGTIKIQDAMQEIPATAITANADIGLQMGHSPANLRYQGNLRFAVTTDYKGLTLHQNGRLDFDQDNLDFTVDLRLDQQALQLSGSVTDYLKISPLPPLVINVTGQEVDIDELLASLALLSEEQGSTKPVNAKGKNAAPRPAAALVPDDLTVRGEVRIAKATYQQVEINDFHLSYSLAETIFKVRDLTGSTMGGNMQGETEVHLQTIPSYEGKLGLHNLRLAEVQKTFAARSPAKASGTLSSAMTFTGKGISPEQIRKEISAVGKFAMANGRLSGADFSKALAALLDLPELTDIDLQDMGGDFIIKKGVAQIRSQTSNSSFTARMNGSIGLDGSLNMPVALRLSPRLSSRLESRLTAARYMEKEDDRILVNLTLTGTLDSPKVKLDTTQVRRRATESLIDQALGEDADPEEKAVGEAVKNLLDNLFE
ncbi:MAG: hypothetical protein C0613_10435 [Desulfobulbaceae bacterium]|nr:MAG: hypothetical protein C0613_10435 [Desulfobulbaceae bacterium]